MVFQRKYVVPKSVGGNLEKMKNEFLRNSIKGSFNKYVLMTLPFFDHLSTSMWAFFILNVDKNGHFIFWTTYPPHFVHVVIERTLM